jgi:hypothetical protein
MTEPVSYLELNSPDLDRSSAFFTTVFGWELRPFAGVGRGCYFTDPPGCWSVCTSTTPRRAEMADYQADHHRPAPGWQTGVEFRRQPGVERHFATMRSWLEHGVLLLGGPYLDAME